MEISSSVAAIFAVSAGGRKPVPSTIVPSSTRSVTAATAVEQRPRLVDAVLGLVGHPEDEVVVDPQAVEAAGLGVGRQLTDPRPCAGALSVRFIHGEDHADLHVRHGTGRSGVER